MATKAKNYPPNDMSRRAKTRKENRCQLCRAKVPIKEQYTVTNDLENGTAVKRKNAGAKGKETASHYCGECASKRVTQKEAWMAGRESGGSKPKPKKGKAKAKKAGKAKAAKKASKPKGVKKPKGAKKPKKAKRSTEEPF